MFEEEKDKPIKINNLFKNYLNTYSKRTRLLIAFMAIGLILFLTGAAIFPFKDKILDTIYPKKQSAATEPVFVLGPNVPVTSYGFTAWDIGGIGAATFSAKLGTQLVNNNFVVNNNSPKNPGNYYIIGKGSQLFSDPSNLKLLTDINLGNMSFSDAVGVSPSGWIMSSNGNGTAFIEEDKLITDVDCSGNKVFINRGTPEGDSKVVKVTAPSTNVAGGYTQIAQTFKRTIITPGQWVIFGAWIKADDFPSVSIFLQNPANSQPFPNPVITSYTKENDNEALKSEDVVARHSNFEDPVSPSCPRIDDLKKKYLPFKWTFVVGYVQVPAGVTSAQLVLRVNKGRAWFDGAVAAPIDSSAVIDSGTYVDNNKIKEIVAARPGSAWVIGNEPGAEEDCYVQYGYVDLNGVYHPGASLDVSYFANIRHTPADIYALIYHQFYKLIKKYDKDAMVITAGFAGASVPWDRENGGPWRTQCSNAQYNPKQYLNDFRTAYKTKFQLSGVGAEPPIDTVSIHYYENEKTPDALNANKFKAYMQNLRTYMDGVAGWQGKPIWINELGTRRSELTDTSGVDRSAEFAQAALTFLKNNTLSIQKWFWFETCGNAGVSPLFEMQTPGVCKKDAFGSPILTKLGQIWASQDEEFINVIKIDTLIQIQDKIQAY